jgi:hypothetical protein
MVHGDGGMMHRLVVVSERHGLETHLFSRQNQKQFLFACQISDSLFAPKSLRVPKVEKFKFKKI